MENINDYRDRELRGPYGIANKIISTRHYPGNELLSFLIVEGDTDRVFYERWTDINRCQIFIAYSKSTAIQVISILEKNMIPGILAIVDADFDVLEGKFPHSPNVLFTDTHDLETMMMKSPGLQKVLSVFGSREKIKEITEATGKDVLTLLLECGITVGYLRCSGERRKDLTSGDRFNRTAELLELHYLALSRHPEP